MDPEFLHCDSLLLWHLSVVMLPTSTSHFHSGQHFQTTRYLRQHKQSTPKKRRFVQSRTYHGDTPTTLPTVIFPAHPLGTYLAEPPWWHHTFCSQIIHLTPPPSHIPPFYFLFPTLPITTDVLLSALFCSNVSISRTPCKMEPMLVSNTIPPMITSSNT